MTDAAIDILTLLELMAARRSFWVIFTGYTIIMALTWLVVLVLIRRLVKKAVRADERVRIAELETSLAYERDLVRSLESELAEAYARLRGVRGILDRADDRPPDKIWQRPHIEKKEQA